MALFRKRKTEYPAFPQGDLEPVLRCSICTGEQVLCARDRKTKEVHELMLIRGPEELEAYCRANGLDAARIEKIY
ncbi:MAG: aspartate dehydrogenase [Mogibacterium sp.]|nr:aspartate dehydrogenase [Mogibacterium sp.]